MAKNMQSKKDQFTKPSKSKLPIILGGAGAVIAALLLFLVFRPSGDSGKPYFGEPIVSSRSYVGRLVSMTRVEPVIEDGLIKLSLNEIDENNIVYFEVENNENQLVPLMAYVTPTGRLFVGSSMCEPCRGRTFSLAGEALVCDTCRTTYAVETHEFISGSQACGSYPPVNMNPVVENGTITIRLEDVLNWRIRT